MYFREFETGQAIVQDASGKVLFQLVSFFRTPSGKTHFNPAKLAYCFAYKKEAEAKCAELGLPLHHVTRGVNLASSFWFIKYDFRSSYAVGFWEV